MKFAVTITRTISQRTSDEIVKSYLDAMLPRVITGPEKHWTCHITRPGQPTQDSKGNWIFERHLLFSQGSGRVKSAPKQWAKICKRLIRWGQSARFNKYPWIVTGSQADQFYAELVAAGKIPGTASDGDNVGGDATPIDPGAKKITISIKSFGEVNTDPGTHFDHIFDREHQIAIIHSAIIAAKESDFVNRFNCVLYGDPGCAKSDLLISTGKMLGKENEAWMKLDATSTTEAGAQKILLESAYVPPVLIVEEIEKTDEKSLRWLLGILDQRAEIRKTNFHIGHKARNVKMLCLATVNDINLFKKVMSGALHSRFAHEIYCPRPTREVMGKILLREVTKVNGKVDWIEPTLKFCVDELQLNDPRKIVPICLCGRDKLLTGEYQKSIRATRPSV